MRPTELAAAIPIDHADEFDAWLAEHGAIERSVVVAFYKKSSGRQTVTLQDLQAVALCHGWIDNLGQRIDDERMALRLTPRRPGSNWSPTNRELVRRLIAEGRMRPAGLALLPPDL
jgi:uncharacterized protein YdeI (YjbR/CyaY-like superfamily)